MQAKESNGNNARHAFVLRSFLHPDSTLSQGTMKCHYLITKSRQPRPCYNRIVLLIKIATEPYEQILATQNRARSLFIHRPGAGRRDGMGWRQQQCRAHTY